MLKFINDATPCWGLWASSPHVGLFLHETHATRKAALASAHSILRKDGADYIEVRRLTFGSRTIVHAQTSGRVELIVPSTSSL